MSLVEALGARYASRCLWQRNLDQGMLVAEALGARHALGCVWQRHLEQAMLQDVSGRGTCFKMSVAEALGARHAS